MGWLGRRGRETCVGAWASIWKDTLPLCGLWGVGVGVGVIKARKEEKHGMAVVSVEPLPRPTASAPAVNCDFKPVRDPSDLTSGPKPRGLKRRTIFGPARMIISPGPLPNCQSSQSMSTQFVAGISSADAVSPGGRRIQKSPSGAGRAASTGPQLPPTESTGPKSDARKSGPDVEFAHTQSDSTLR